MKPPLPHTLSAVPQTLHARLEIAKAIRTLAGPDEDELLRQRRAEIAAIRRDLDELKRDVRKVGEVWLEQAKAGLCSALRKYDPDQPRVPVGNSKGGQWTTGDGGSASAGRYAAPDTGTVSDETNGGGASASAANSGDNRLFGASRYLFDQAAHGLPAPPAFDTSDAAVLGQGDSAEPTTSFRKTLNYRLTDDALYVAGATVVNDDGGLGAAADRFLRTLDGGNPVGVDFQVTVQDENGTNTYSFVISSDKLAVYGWTSVPWTSIGPLKGPAVITVVATNHVPYLTTVIVGATRVQPN